LLQTAAHKLQRHCPSRKTLYLTGLAGAGSTAACCCCCAGGAGASAASSSTSSSTISAGVGCQMCVCVRPDIMLGCGWRCASVCDIRKALRPNIGSNHTRKQASWMLCDGN
jgi:hypothetical protein